jgi:hypothetical protein
MNNQKGYAALILVIFLLFAIITIGVSASYSAVSKIKVSQDSRQNSKNISRLESCVEESLLRINEDNALPPEIMITFDMTEEITCDIELEEYLNNQYTYIINLNTDRIRIIAQRTDRVYIMKWEIL